MDENIEGLVITKETWVNIPEEQRDWIVFSTMQRINLRLQCLERWNKMTSFIGGIAGGFLAALGMKWIN